MIYKVGLSGASGKMGTEIAGVLAGNFVVERDYFELSDAVARAGKLTSIEGVEVRTWEDNPREPVHVWVDFSRPEATLTLLSQIDCPVVIGTTGFTEQQRFVIDDYAKKHPVLLAANTSPGMNLMVRLLKQMPRGLRWVDKIVLSEEHHAQKVDAPSGTAKRLLSLLRENGYPDVQLEVIRAGNIRGNHSVRLIGQDEELEFSHRVFDRATFAKGALWGAWRLLKQKSPRIYSMDELEETSHE